MDERKRAAILKKAEEEPYSNLLNIKLKNLAEGYALCEMMYTEQMDNIYESAHGGAIFSLIDEAFEISSNSHENVAVALNMNVTYMKPPKKNMLLTAESKETHRTRRTASYCIEVKCGEDLIAVCQALVYVKGEKTPFS